MEQRDNCLPPRIRLVDARLLLIHRTHIREVPADSFKHFQKLA